MNLDQAALVPFSFYQSVRIRGEVFMPLNYKNRIEQISLRASIWIRKINQTLQLMEEV